VFYAYILESLTTPREFYRGHDSDLKHRPWRIKFYAAFETLTLAQKFELSKKRLRPRVCRTPPQNVNSLSEFSSGTDTDRPGAEKRLANSSRPVEDYRYE
jgi:hypothetical protein